MCPQASEVRVNFVVMRSTEAHEEADGGGGGEGRSGRGARRAPEQQYFRRHSTFLKVSADPGGRATVRSPRGAPRDFDSLCRPAGNRSLILEACDDMVN